MEVLLDRRSPISQHFTLASFIFLPQFCLPAINFPPKFPTNLAISKICPPSLNRSGMKQRRPLQLVFVLLGHLLILLQRSAECSNQLRHSQANKQFIDQLREGHYEIVHPFQLRDKSRERMSIDTREQFLNSTPAQHFRRVSFVVRSSVLVHQRLRLTLALNEHLLATARDELDENGGVKRVDVGENCFYQGSMIGEPESFVALSTCQGLWGLLLFANGTALGIWPLKGGDQGRRHPHILFRVNTAEETGCGTTSRERHRQRREKQGGEGMAAAAGRQRKERLFLELALLIDNEMMSQFNTSLPKAFEYSLNALNLADLLLRRGLNLRLAVNFAQVWADDAQPRPNGHQMLISRLLDYVSGHLYGQEKDATLLLTGNRFSSSNHTMAAVEASVCSSRAVGFVQVLDPFAPHQTGLRLAHSIGHMLGLDHDSPDCGCSTAAAADGSAPAAPCVMAEPFGPSPLFPVHFSPCSSGRLLSQRLGHHLRCLADRPRLLASDRAAAFLCGNGQIDAGEECDCGRRDQCRDPCCDPLSCQLRPHAQCAGHQPCCQGCQLRPVGHPCRSAQSVCDVPESCDGASGDCPVDGHLLDGTSCGIGGNGQCWQGQCRDPEAQCRLLWGQGARLADELCFGQNGRALEYGNCGRDADGAFVECAPENERCGLLHCRDGAASPSGHLPANATSFALQFAGKGSRLVQCKVVTNSALGLVQDGTGCGPGRVCLQAVCLPLAQVSPPVQCPSAPGHQQMPCSGHGDCTTSRQCLCFDGWAGSACELRAAGKRKEPSLGRQPPELVATSFGPGSRFGNRALLMETATLLAILLLVGVLLLLLLVCLLLFYRRKSSGDSSRGRRPQVKASSADEEDLPVDGEEAEEAGGRAIKFGQMPSWREEKRKWKTNKRVYDALQRITEANEADSLSLKSRESSVAANNSLLHHGQPQQLLHSSASLADNRRPEVSSPPHSLRHSPAPSSLHGAGGTASAMYIAENYFPHNSADESAEAGLMLLGMGTMDRREHQGQQQQTSMADGMASTASFGPRLANISLLMQKLDTFEGEEASNRAGALRAPDSTDSGNAGSSQDIRESPSLFSDPYRLDLPG